MALSEPPKVGTAMLPPGTFANDVVVVTGGGTGIGRALSAEFGRRGAAVAIASRKEEHRKQGVATVEEAGGRVSDLAGGPPDATGREVVASNGRVHEALRAQLA